jgi:hypothetical protein
MCVSDSRDVSLGVIAYKKKEKSTSQACTESQSCTLLYDPTLYDQSPSVNCIEKVIQACDDYFNMHQLDGPYCNGEKNNHHHMAVMGIVAIQRQVIH